MGKISQLPLSNRPQEKAIKYGIKSLSDCELLALIIRTGTKDVSVLELSLQMICDFKGLSNIINSSFYELSKCNGISKVKALQINAIKEIYNRISQNNEQIAFKEIKLSSGDEVYNYLHLKIENLFQERLIVLYLNIKNVILYEEIISIGDESSTILNNKLICKNAIEKYAKKVIIAHNHPSGNCNPSLADIQAFYQLKSALSLIQVKLLDHIIIGKDSYYSFYENKNVINK
jgi:DNA repair protein RadC